MKVVIDRYAWLRLEDLSAVQLQVLKRTLTVVPRKVGDHPGEDPEPILLWRETDTHIGVPREYFLTNRKATHEIEYAYSKGAPWPGDVPFHGKLRDEQERGLSEVLARFAKPHHTGGIVRAKPGWGKTVFCLSVVSALRVPTLVVVHKEFLMDQWKERINMFLPKARVGLVQKDTCEFDGCHVVLAMVHSLAGKPYPNALYKHFGLVITDECHRIGAETWSSVPAKFDARWRLGVSATPRRKDGADAVFRYQIGEVFFESSEQRLAVKVKRVWSSFRLVKTERFNPSLAPRSLILKFLVASRSRNELVAKQVVSAVSAGRKVLVLSERLHHLQTLDAMFRDLWRTTYPKAFVEGREEPKTGFYVGGTSKEDLKEGAEADVIFATVQYAAEGLDIPSLDTLVLATPMTDIEQAVGRIQRPFTDTTWRWNEDVKVLVPGKKEPIVVDIRDDNIPLFKRAGDSRDRLFSQVT